jgi:hypothetical protein
MELMRYHAWLMLSIRLGKLEKERRNRLDSGDNQSGISGQLPGEDTT